MNLKKITIGLIYYNFSNWDFMEKGLKSRLLNENVRRTSDKEINVQFQGKKFKIAINSEVTDYTIIEFYGEVENKFHQGLPQIVRGIFLEAGKIKFSEIEYFNEFEFNKLSKSLNNRITNRTKVFQSLKKGTDVGAAIHKDILKNKELADLEIIEKTIFNKPVETKFLTSKVELNQIRPEEFLLRVGIHLQLDVFDFIWGSYRPTNYKEIKSNITEQSLKLVEEIGVPNLERSKIITIDEVGTYKTFLIKTEEHFHYLIENWQI